MRLVNHVILDFESKTDTRNYSYWLSSFVDSQSTHVFLSYNTLHSKYTSSIGTGNKSYIFKNNTKFTILAPTTIHSKGLHAGFNLLKNNPLKSLPFVVSWSNLINSNFIRKERVYTKLKYSRTPGYDIVSGGSAVILAGFIGFLVSEKYGIELVDSGDFYYLWMYAVFLCFMVRPLLTSLSVNESIWSLLSPRHIITHFITVTSLILKYFK